VSGEDRKSREDKESWPWGTWRAAHNSTTGSNVVSLYLCTAAHRYFLDVWPALTLHYIPTLLSRKIIFFQENISNPTIRMGV
jgi:hypothetical protein